MLANQFCRLAEARQWLLGILGKLLIQFPYVTHHKGHHEGVCPVCRGMDVAENRVSVSSTPAEVLADPRHYRLVPRNRQPSCEPQPNVETHRAPRLMVLHPLVTPKGLHPTCVSWDVCL